MLNKQKNIKKQGDLNEETNKMISGASVPWSKSKEEVWAELEKRMESTETPAKTVILRPWMSMAAAAVFALLIGISAFMQIYTKKIRVPAGQHSSIILPDNSHVRINARSIISYKPLMWRFSRNVKLEGEAYFEVQKGKKFTVTSANGKTTVLGTSFNIYSRNSNYQVTCISGNVKVMTRISKKEVILDAGQKAALSAKGILEVQTDINTGQALSWTENRFSFTSVPVKQVFEEIARQYDIIISVPATIDKTYTGAFNKSASADEVLNLVCRPLNLTYMRKSQNEYVISWNN
ncbi:MAG: FecR domain-containing protein [Bacteroidales bacterium]|nr:FecR domain-containing protein [Bacteroidales bacterium]